MDTHSSDQDLSTFEYKKPKEAKIAAKSKLFGLLVLLVLVLGSFFIANQIIKEEKNNLEQHLKQQIEVLTLERSNVISEWLAGILKQSRSITKNDIFRLYAVEQDSKKEEGKDTVSKYADQLPYMINALSDFVQDTEYRGAYMLNRDGETFLASMDSRPLDNEQKLEALRLFDNGQASYSVVRSRDEGLEFDLFVPVFPVDETAGSNKISAIFVFTIPVKEQFKLLLHDKPVNGVEGSYSLFQRTFDAKIQEVRLINGETILDSALPISVFSTPTLSFGKRADFNGSANVYSFGAAIQATPFYLVWQTPEDVANAQIDKFILNTYLVAIFFVLSLVTAFGAFWWRNNSDHNKVLAEQYAKFAHKLGKQKMVLDSINNTIKEFITLKDRYGKYIYVNPAFAEAVGSSVENILGQDDASILGHGTAMKLEKLDDLVISSKEALSVVDEIYLQGEKRHLQISKFPYLSEDEGEEERNIITVARDITDLVEEQARREKSTKQTVLALIRAVELRDPHLAGHSKRVAEIASLVANEIKPDPRIRRTVEIAATLSQVGKLDIPSEILTSEKRLSDEQFEIMKRHVGNAEKIITDIDFDVPVLTAISHMYERLDGSGYPRAIHDDEVSLEGRILGVCDYFCARIEPRSYRQAILPKDALKYLEQNSKRYDPKVVQALRTVIHSSVGERIIASVVASHKDM